MEYAVIALAVALIVLYFAFRTKKSEWTDKVRDYINNGPVPDKLPAQAVFLLPGGGGKTTAPVALEAARKWHPVCFIISSSQMDERRGMRTILSEGGVEPHKIVEETHATSTPENALFSAAINPYPNSPAVIFKQRFHLLRCQECYRRAGFAFLTLYPTDAPGTKLNRAEDEGKKIAEDILEMELGATRDWPGGLG